MAVGTHMASPKSTHVCARAHACECVCSCMCVRVHTHTTENMLPSRAHRHSSSLFITATRCCASDLGSPDPRNTALKASLPTLHLLSPLSFSIAPHRLPPNPQAGPFYPSEGIFYGRLSESERQMPPLCPEISICFPAEHYSL